MCVDEAVLSNTDLLSRVQKDSEILETIQTGVAKLI